MLSATLKIIPSLFLEPVLSLFRIKDFKALQPDIIAGLTVAVILLPQAIAYAMVAELPPEVGLYTAIVGAIVGALWGCSNQLHTGPTNTASLLLLTVLITVVPPGTPEFMTAAGLTAVMLGEIPRSLPALAPLPIFDLKLIAELSTGALFVLLAMLLFAP